MQSIETLAQQLLAQDRRALSKAITLVESNKTSDRARALALLDILMPHTGKAIRVGVSGSPGVGKSSFIEALGKQYIAAGARIAALTIDPSSQLTGGSILGDKTRMPNLAVASKAYIRPTPSANVLGGVARRSREVIACCEAAGYEVIFIETVGVGQSETEVADMTDCYLLLIQPASGDALQGIKRGIMERADIVIINKADGELLAAAQRSAAHYQQALALMPNQKLGKTSDWQRPVLLCSSTEASGLNKVQAAINDFIHLSRQNKHFDQARAAQNQAWLKTEILANLTTFFAQNDEMQNQYQQLSKTLKPTSSPARMAQQFIQKHFSEKGK